MFDWISHKNYNEIIIFQTLTVSWEEMYFFNPLDGKLFCNRLCNSYSIIEINDVKLQYVLNVRHNTKL
jgi:hypothetical protein